MKTTIETSNSAIRQYIAVMYDIKDVPSENDVEERRSIYTSSREKDQIETGAVKLFSLDLSRIDKPLSEITYTDLILSEAKLVDEEGNFMPFNITPLDSSSKHIDEDIVKISEIYEGL